MMENHTSRKLFRQCNQVEGYFG